MNAKTKGANEEKKESGCHHHAGTPPASLNSSKFE